MWAMKYVHLCFISSLPSNNTENPGHFTEYNLYELTAPKKPGPPNGTPLMSF